MADDDPQKADFAAQVMKAFMESKYKWRTIGGVATELGTEKDKVAGVVKASDGYLRAKALNERGEELFTTAARYRQDSSSFTKFLSAATNSVID